MVDLTGTRTGGFPTEASARNRALVAAGEPVAVVLAEVAGQSLRWLRDRDGARASLPIIDAVVDAAVDAAGGTVWARDRGAFAAHFETVDAALVVADALASGLAALGPDEAPMRFAVHQGPLVRRGGVCGGPAAAEGERLLAAAPVGSVLVSSSAREAAGDRDGLTSVGRMRLDVRGPATEVFAVAQGELLERPSASSFSPDDPAFVGRQAELADLISLIAEQRLVTIRGLGGTGKSRLLAEVGRVLGDHVTGVSRLSEASDQISVARQLAMAAGLDPEMLGERKPPEVLDLAATAIGDDECVLLVDGGDEGGGALGRHLEFLLGRCPKLSVLAAAREPLNIADERLWPVPFFSEGAALLRRRSADHGADLADDGAGVLGVEALVEQLGASPLAIELAAAQLADRSVTDLLAELRSSQPLPVPNRPTVDGASAVSAMVASALARFDPAERLAFLRLSVFPAGFAESAVTHMAPDLDDALATLDRLVARALVRPRSTPVGVRYAMPEAVRGVAQATLAAEDDYHAAMASMVDHFLAVAPTGPDERHGHWQRARRAVPDLQSVAAALAALGDQRRADRYEALAGAYAGVAARFGDADRFGEALRWPVAVTAAAPVVRAETYWALTVCGRVGTRPEFAQEGTIGLTFLHLDAGNRPALFVERQAALDDMAVAFRAGTTGDTADRRLARVEAAAQASGHPHEVAATALCRAWFDLLNGEWGPAAEDAASVRATLADAYDDHVLATATEAVGQLHAGEIGRARELAEGHPGRGRFDHWGDPLSLVLALAMSASEPSGVDPSPVAGLGAEIARRSTASPYPGHRSDAALVLSWLAADRGEGERARTLWRAAIWGRTPITQHLVRVLGVRFDEEPDLDAGLPAGGELLDAESELDALLADEGDHLRELAAR